MYCTVAEKDERRKKVCSSLGPVLASPNQGSFFWLQNTEGEPVVGAFATNHHPPVLPPYFAARKKNPAPNDHHYTVHLIWCGLIIDVDDDYSNKYLRITCTS
jgi:hypothetical protein